MAERFVDVDRVLALCDGSLDLRQGKPDELVAAETLLAAYLDLVKASKDALRALLVACGLPLAFDLLTDGFGSLPPARLRGIEALAAKVALLEPQRAPVIAEALVAMSICWLVGGKRTVTRGIDLLSVATSPRTAALLRGRGIRTLKRGAAL